VLLQIRLYDGTNERKHNISSQNNDFVFTNIHRVPRIVALKTMYMQIQVRTYIDFYEAQAIF